MNSNTLRVFGLGEKGLITIAPRFKCKKQTRDESIPTPVNSETRDGLASTPPSAMFARTATKVPAFRHNTEHLQIKSKRRCVQVRSQLVIFKSKVRSGQTGRSNCNLPRGVLNSAYYNSGDQSE